jgi:hypothetical protein
VPFTFLAHQAPILPAFGSGRRPLRWKVDGVALVVGSAMPDLLYVFSGTSLAFNTHAFLTLWWTSIPISVVVAIAFRRVVAGPLSVHLPQDELHLRDYGTVAVRRPSLLSTLLCAAIGAYTHVLLDEPTHADTWLAAHWSPLRWVVFTYGGHGYHVTSVLQYGLSVVLGCVTVWWLWWSGRRRLLLADGARPPSYGSTATSARRLWGCTAVGVVVGIALLVTTPHLGSPVAAFERAAAAMLLGLCLGAVWAAGALTTEPLATRP